MNSTPLGDLTTEVFLAEYWQKKPLLIRNAVNLINSPASADVLAGLACEEEVESRLIIQNEQDWELRYGPFNEATFKNLPASHWTLLVQAVDHYLPDASRLLEQFDFIPRWRIDDLMMSVASDGGGVGPHFDQYDVFLLQTDGQRQWEIGAKYAHDASLKENLPVKILKDFAMEQCWILSPGDMLYVPPGISHNGIAIGDNCITCSIGFRAPSHSEILREYTDYLADQLNDEIRYQDINLHSQQNPGEITSQTIENIQHILRQHIDNTTAISEWFGRYATTPKYADTDWEDSVNDLYKATEVKAQLANHAILKRNESSRFAYSKQGQQHILYVDGKHIDTDKESNNLIEILCSKFQFSGEDFILSEVNLNLIAKLLAQDSLYIQSD